MSKLVCKHHNEWAYGGDYFSALAQKAEEVLQKGIDLKEDEARKQELETLKKERMEAFEAKVKQLAWGALNHATAAICLNLSMGS